MKKAQTCVALLRPCSGGSAIGLSATDAQRVVAGDSDSVCRTKRNSESTRRYLLTACSLFVLMRHAPPPRPSRRPAARNATPAGAGRADTRGIAARALLVLASLRLRPPQARRACAVRDPMGRRCVVGRITPACAVSCVRSTWGYVAASELDGCDDGVGGVSRGVSITLRAALARAPDTASYSQSRIGGHGS